jgi:fatty acid desaturase
MLRFILFALCIVWGLLWVFDYISQTAWFVLLGITMVANAGVARFQIRKHQAATRQTNSYQAKVDASLANRQEPE